MDFSIKKISGKAVYVTGNDIDTDRIIPARFMKCVTFDGLGQFLFYDVRFHEDGSSKNHALDQPEHKSASILLADENFGCGSSREHAPQALAKFGIKAIIAGSFAEIFFGNCTTLGIPCVCLPEQDRKSLAQYIKAHPQEEIILDLENKLIKTQEKNIPCLIHESARSSLLQGTYDALFELLSAGDQVKQVASRIYN